MRAAHGLLTVSAVCYDTLCACIQVNTATLLKSLPPHLRNMIVKGKGTMPIHAAAVAAAQAGRQPIVGSPQVFSHTHHVVFPSAWANTCSSV